MLAQWQAGVGIQANHVDGICEPMSRIPRRRDVHEQTGLGRSSTYSMMNKSLSPKAVKLGPLLSDG